MNRRLSPQELVRHRNIIAARLSVIPGLGQIYKGHYMEATGVMFLGMVLAVWLGNLLFLTPSAGTIRAFLGFRFGSVGMSPDPRAICVGFFALLLFWGCVAFEAFAEPDLRHRPS